MSRLKYFLSALLLILSVNVYTQLTSSPYSIFGVGIIEENSTGYNQALGGSGIALLSKKSLNSLNPASYNGIDSLNFIFETESCFKFTSYSTNDESKKKNDAGINYLAIGFRINKRWANSIGIKPYSSVDYSIQTGYYIEGENRTYYKNFSGNGGISYLYYGNSIMLNKNISLGINGSYFFGSITHSEIFDGNNFLRAYEFTRKVYMNTFYLDYGLLVSVPVKGMTYSAGITYGGKKQFNSSNSYTLVLSDETDDLEDSENDQEYYIPENYGIGISIEKNNMLNISADYSRSRWSEVNFNNTDVKTRDGEKYSFGIEFTPSHEDKHRGFKTWTYRLGSSYNKSYLIVDDYETSFSSFSCGLGLPLWNNKSRINISFKTGENGTLNSGLIKEKYNIIYLNLSFQEMWFKKYKFD